jgi:hypothetical protein
VIPDGFDARLAALQQHFRLLAEYTARAALRHHHVLQRKSAITSPGLAFFNMLHIHHIVDQITQTARCRAAQMLDVSGFCESSLSIAA